jgi:RHS repeat-associated protein
MSQVTQTGNGGDAVAAKTVTFAYDRLGEFTGISRYQNADATANLVAQAAYGYDLNGNLTSLVYSKANSTLPSYSWTYDSLGNMTSSSETLGSIVDAVSYTSDSTGQLLSATATSGPPSESYSYDSNGNRETVTTTGGQVTCITGPDNELLYDGTYYYQYDADGNQIARWVDNNSGSESSPQPNDTNITIYTWDNRNRLTSVTSYANYAAYQPQSGSPTPDMTVTYAYDVFNRWIGETVTTGGTTTQTRYVYDGNQIVMQFQGTGSGPLAANNLSDRYLWGPAVDQLLADEQLVPAVGGYDLTSPGTTVWTLTDNENTVRDLATYNPTTQTTTVVNHREFSAYGELLSQTNPQTGQAAAVDCVFAYTGRALDEATGLQNNGERWYEAITGRWLSQDPIGFGGGINLYEYVGDAPLRGVDPTGEDVYIQSTRAANGWHWQICVDTWGDGCSKKTGKYCISFAGNRGAWFGSCGTTCPCGGGAPGLPPVTAPSTMPAGFPTNPAAKGQVYPSTSPAVKEIVRTPHTCEEDERILIWLASLVGVHGNYAATGPSGFNCRDFSQLIYESIPKTLYPEWPYPNPPSVHAPGQAPPEPEYPNVFEETF